MPLAEPARRLWSLIARHQPWSILGPLLVVQWLALAVFAVAATHNGWLYYQGGDQSYYWTDAHLLSQWTLPVALVGYAWSYLLIPVAFFAGSNVLSGLPVVIVLNALFLLPVALLCVYGIATRIAGRVFGYWAAALWIVIPYATIPMFDQRYHEKYVDITLPQSLGLTVLADFPSTVVLLVTAWLLVRALDTRDWTDAVLAGLVGGFAIGLKPSNALFFGAAVLCLLVAARWVQTAAFLAALVPGLFLLALWKQRGLGELPAFASMGGSGGSMAAIGADAPIGSLFSPVHRYVSLDWHHLHQNIDGVREFFWAVRPLEFVPLAGLLAIGRRSWPKAVLVFGWFITFLVIKGTDDKANIEDASFFRLLMPSFPAFLLLLASIPLLVPAFSWSRRVLPNPLPALPTRRAGRRALAAAAAVLVVLAPVVRGRHDPAEHGGGGLVPVPGRLRARPRLRAEGGERRRTAGADLEQPVRRGRPRSSTRSSAPGRSRRIPRRTATARRSTASRAATAGTAPRSTASCTWTTSRASRSSGTSTGRRRAAGRTASE